MNLFHLLRKNDNILENIFTVRFIMHVQDPQNQIKNRDQKEGKCFSQAKAI